MATSAFVDVEGVDNFRDLGGYLESIDTHKDVRVRRGVVYRSAHISRITPNGAEQLRNGLKLKRIFDLRSYPELSDSEDMSSYDNLTPGVERVVLPVFPEQGFSPYDLVERYQDTGLLGAYIDMLAMLPRALRPILEYLRDNPQTPILLHCTAGKDRTGLICAVILSLLGCSDEQVIAEYHLTEMGLVKLRSKLLEKFLSDPAIAERKDTVLELLSARQETMRKALDTLRERYGSVENYVVVECQLASQDIEIVRSNLLDRPGEPEDSVSAQSRL